jgi:adenylate kinase
MTDRHHDPASAPPAAGRGPRVVLLGAPGSGKGTQAARVASRLGVPVISTGEMLRQAVAAGTPLGERVRDVLRAGELVDDGLMAEIVRRRLAVPDAARGFILDGYPRTPGQADTLQRLLGNGSGGLDAVVLLNVPETVLIERATARGRDDDREAVVRERLRLFREKTEPLIGYYGERRLLHEVDGHQPVDAVTSQILAALAGGA